MTVPDMVILMGEGMQALDFGQFRLLPAKRLLTQGGVPVPLSGRALDILLILIERRLEVVSKEELMRRVWGPGGGGREHPRGPSLGAAQARPCTTASMACATSAPCRAAAINSSPRSRRPASPSPWCRRRRLAPHTAPLVTLTGPGGIGKTRLAVAVGERVRAEYPGGICWVGLVAVTDAAVVAGTVVQALGLPLGGAPALAQLAARLKDQRRLLIFAALIGATDRAHRENWAEAEILLQDARNLCVEHGYHKALVRVDAEIALKYLIENRLDDAETALARASILNKVVLDDWNEIAIVARYSTLYALKGDFRASLDKWREIFTLSKSLGNSDLLEVQLDCLFMLLVINQELPEACDLLIRNREHFERPARNITNSLRSVILHLGSGLPAEAIRLYGYIGRNWPHRHSRRSLAATLFRAVGPLLHDVVPERLRRSWTAEGQNFSIEHARTVCVSGIDSFIDYVVKTFEGGRAEPGHDG
jgi:tetratricopeptide (TPR) repeat protein